MQRLETYEPSGGTGLAPIVIPIGGAIAAFVLAAVYAYLNLYIPIAGYITILFVIGYAVGVGLAVGYLARLSHCRNRTVLTVTSLVVALFAIYFDWFWFEYVLFTKEIEEPVPGLFSELLFDPGAVGDIASEIAAEGWYTVRNWTPSGTVLWLFWGIEVLIILGGVYFLAQTIGDERVYCERCRSWVPAETEKLLAMPEVAVDREHARRGNPEVLSETPTASSHVAPRLELDVSDCTGCNDLHVLQVYQVTRDEKGKDDRKAVSPRLLLGRERLAAVLSDAKRPKRERSNPS